MWTKIWESIDYTYGSIVDGRLYPIHWNTVGYGDIIDH